MGKRIETGFNKYITEEELGLLDEWFNKKGDNYQLVYNLLKYTGIRISDAVRCNISWFQKDFLVFTMFKTKRSIKVYLPKNLKVAINDYYIPKHEHKFQEGFLIYNSQSNRGLSPYKHLQTNTIRTEFHRFRKHHNIRDVYHVDRRGRNLHRLSPHTLRHLFADRAYKQSGYNARVVQDLLGHKEHKTTMKYLRGIRNTNHHAKICETIASTM